MTKFNPSTLKAAIVGWYMSNVISKALLSSSGQENTRALLISNPSSERLPPSRKFLAIDNLMKDSLTFNTWNFEIKSLSIRT